MKTIFPSNNNIPAKVVSNPITQVQYDELVDKVNDAVEQLNNGLISLDNFKKEIAAAFTTKTLNVVNQLNALNAAIDSLEAGEGKITEFTSEFITTRLLEVTNISVEGTLNADNITTDNIKANSGDVTNLKANTIESQNITSDSVNAKNIHVEENIDFDEFTAEKGTVDELYVTEKADVESIGARNAIIDELRTTNAEIDEITATNSATCCLDVNYITHLNDPQEVDLMADTGDYYILLPRFTNGFYYLEARNDTNKLLWSSELTNSQNNVQFRWSKTDLGSLLDFKLSVAADGSAVVQLHANTLNEHVSLYRQSQSTDNTLPPTIYDTDQLPDVSTESEQYLLLTDYAGTWIQDVIFTNKLHIKQLEMDSLFMDCVGITKQLHLTCDMEWSGDICKPITTCGEVDQYVQNREICGVSTPTWVEPSHYPTVNDTRLIDSNGVAVYDGSVDYDEGVSVYPIVHLNECSCAHGNLDVATDLTIGNNASVGNDLTVVNATVTDTFKSRNIQNGVLDIDCGLVVTSEEVCSYSCLDAVRITFGDGSQKYYTYEISEAPASENRLCNLQEITPGGEVTCCTTFTYYSPARGCYLMNVYPGTTCNFIMTSNVTTRVYNNPTNGFFPVLKADSFTRCGGENTDDVECLGDWVEGTSKIERGLFCWITNVKPAGKIYRKQDDRLDELAVYNCEGPLNDSKPVVYNATTNALETTERISIDEGVFDKLTVNCAYVQELHAVKEQQEVATSDYLTLRANNESALTTNQKSGIIVNNYDGSNVAAIVTDDEGTLRVGTGTKVDTEYDDIYFANDKWYADESLTAEVTPEGSMTAWSSIEETDDYTHYTNAIFSAYNFDVKPVIHKVDTGIYLSNNGYHTGYFNLDETLAVVDPDTVPVKSEEITSVVFTYNEVSTGRTATITDQSQLYWFASRENPSRPSITLGDGAAIPSPFKYSVWVIDDWSFDNGVLTVYSETEAGTSTSATRFWEWTIANGTFVYNEETRYTNSLQPVLTRDEVENLTDNAVFVLDKANLTAKTLTLPTTNGSSLKYNTETNTYYWEKSAGVYRFATTSDYEDVADTIPVDSMIIIEDETDYTVSEDK